MIENRVFEIRYLSLTITLTAQADAQLPVYLGSTLRGVIGQSLYRVDREAFEFLYTNGNKADGKQDIVKPYIIIPPEIGATKREIRKGEELTFRFIFLGNAVKYVPSLTKALQKIDTIGLGANRYPFYLYKIVNKENDRILWWNGDYFGAGEEIFPISCRSLSNVTGVIVRMCTPLRIRRGGKLLTTISFETLIRNIINRIIMVTERYGGWMDEEEAKKVLGLAAGIETVRQNIRMEHLERYSNRVHRKMDFSGLLGELEYSGDLTEFVPWLLAAQILHIGRNTTFGMGRIEVEFI